MRLHVREGLVADALHAVGDGQIGEGEAALERTVPDGGHAVVGSVDRQARYRHRLQVPASFEGSLADRGKHGGIVRRSREQRDRPQVFAAREQLVRKGGDPGAA